MRDHPPHHRDGLDLPWERTDKAAALAPARRFGDAVGIDDVPALLGRGRARGG